MQTCACFFIEWVTLHVPAQRERGSIYSQRPSGQQAVDGHRCPPFSSPVYTCLRVYRLNLYHRVYHFHYFVGPFHGGACYESFYGSPPNFSLTKSPMLKLAPGQFSSNTVPLATPTSSSDSPLCTQENIMKVLLSLHPSPCRAAVKRPPMKIAGFEGGYIVEPVLSPSRKHPTGSHSSERVWL